MEVVSVKPRKFDSEDERIAVKYMIENAEK